jgi:hypothetical protein
MIILTNKRKATKKAAIIAQTAKIVAMIRRRIERKIEDVLGEDQFGFRRGKGTRNAIGMLKRMSWRTLEIDEKSCVFSQAGRRHLTV